MPDTTDCLGAYVGPTEPWLVLERAIVQSNSISALPVQRHCDCCRLCECAEEGGVEGAGQVQRDWTVFV